MKYILLNGLSIQEENDKRTKTLLCVMIRSLGAKYNDMIAMHPIVSLNSEFFLSI